MMALGVATVGAARPAVAATEAQDQRFLLIQKSDGGQGELQVFATGPIFGFGTAKADQPSPATAAAPADSFTLTFGAGTVTYKVTQTADTVIESTAPACVEYATVDGTFTISGGTGAYAKASGTGTIEGSLLRISAAEPAGTCAKTPARELRTMSATGTAATE